jgi:hypothetical protein
MPWIPRIGIYHTMAAYPPPPTPSDSFNDPGWIPGYGNLNPSQRTNILVDSIWLERRLIHYLASVARFNEIKIAEGVSLAIEWRLMVKRSDGNVRLEFSYKYQRPTWTSIRASPVVFIRTFISGQYEEFQRFVADADFNESIFMDDRIRPLIYDALYQFLEDF